MARRSLLRSLGRTDAVHEAQVKALGPSLDAHRLAHPGVAGALFRACAGTVQRALRDPEIHHRALIENERKKARFLGVFGRSAISGTTLDL